MLTKRTYVVLILIALLLASASAAFAARQPLNTPPETANCVGVLTSASDANGEEVPATVELLGAKGVSFGAWIAYVSGYTGTVEECRQVARAALFCIAVAPSTEAALACLEN